MCALVCDYHLLCHTFVLTIAKVWSDEAKRQEKAGPPRERARINACANDTFADVASGINNHGRRGYAHPRTVKGEPESSDNDDSDDVDKRLI